MYFKRKIDAYLDEWLNKEKRSPALIVGIRQCGKTESIQEFACRTFKAIGANGVARIDFLMDNKSKEIFVNEINTIPGSLAFYLWEASGIKYPELLNRLISLAFKRQRERESLAFEINTNILAQTAFGAKGAKGSKF